MILSNVMYNAGAAQQEPEAIARDVAKEHELRILQRDRKHYLNYNRNHYT